MISPDSTLPAAEGPYLVALMASGDAFSQPPSSPPDPPEPPSSLASEPPSLSTQPSEKGEPSGSLSQNPSNQPSEKREPSGSLSQALDSLAPEGLYTCTPGDSLSLERSVNPGDPSFPDSLTPLGPTPAPRPTDPQPTSEGWTIGSHTTRTPAQTEQLQQLLRRNAGVYAYGWSSLGVYRGREGAIKIPLTNEKVTVAAKPRRLHPEEDRIMEEKIGPLLEHGIVVRCKSAQYASNNVIAAKRDEAGGYTDARVCHNYRPINALMKQDSYQIPRTDQLHQEVSGKKWLSKLDARSGFLQIPISEEDQPKTAFWYKGQLYQYTRMPFGMKNSPAEFQKRMDAAIQEHGLSEFCVVYIDDLLVHSATFEEHLVHLQKVFDMLIAINVRAHPGKSTFGADTLEFLGHNVSQNGISPSEAKVAAIRSLPSPTCLSELRTVLGFMGYYRGYVPNYSALASPLTALLKKDAPWQWRAEVEEAAYQELKNRLCDPSCALRRADFSKPFILHTDWSNRGMGAVLGQIDDEGREGIVAAISRSLNKHEKNYASYKGEMSAVAWAIKTLDFYLRWSPFTLVTDHAPLVWLMSNNDLVGQYARDSS